MTRSINPGLCQRTGGNITGDISGWRLEVSHHHHPTIYQGHISSFILIYDLVCVLFSLIEMFKKSQVCFPSFRPRHAVVWKVYADNANQVSLDVTPARAVLLKSLPREDFLSTVFFYDTLYIYLLLFVPAVSPLIFLPVNFSQIQYFSLFFSETCLPVLQPSLNCSKFCLAHFHVSAEHNKPTSWPIIYFMYSRVRFLQWQLCEIVDSCLVCDPLHAWVLFNSDDI